MEEGSGADEGWLRLECDALLGLRLLQILAAGEMTVDQRSIGQRPRVQEMFGGLQFGGVGREEVQIDVVGHTQAQAGVLSGTIQRQHNLLLGADSHLARKGSEFSLFSLEERDAH